MKVAIDASSTVREQGTGVAVYIENLCRALGPVAPDFEFSLYYRFSRLGKSDLFLDLPGPNFRTLVPPLHLVQSPQLDVAHCPDSRLLELGRAAKVVTVHDVFSLISEDWANEKFRRKKAKRYSQIARRADLIICDSSSTADDFGRLFGEAARKLRVVPLGVGPEFHPREAADCKGVLERLGIRGPYLLHVGNIASRKNLIRLLAAFETLAEGYPELHLVLAGRLSYRHDEVLEKVSRSPFRERIVLPGYVSASELPFLYSGAEMLVFPSLYEGFGLPALEAFACAIPVIAADRSSLPEVVADAGLLVNPEKEVEIADAVDKLLGDSSLRARLGQAGRERACEFSWERTARETVAVYREAAASGGRAGEQENR